MKVKHNVMQKKVNTKNSGLSNSLYIKYKNSNSMMPGQWLSLGSGNLRGAEQGFWGVGNAHFLIWGLDVCSLSTLPFLILISRERKT